MEASNPTIPLLKKPVSLMDAGPNGNDFAAQAAARHPVDDLQLQQNPFQNLEYVRSMYGSGLAMRLATEQKIAAQHTGTNLPSAQLYREICSGTDVQLDFGDFLSLPEHRPDVKKINHHKVMESQLGIYEVTTTQDQIRATQDQILTTQEQDLATLRATQDQILTTQEEIRAMVANTAARTFNSAHAGDHSFAGTLRRIVVEVGDRVGKSHESFPDTLVQLNNLDLDAYTQMRTFYGSGESGLDHVPQNIQLSFINWMCGR